MAQSASSLLTILIYLLLPVISLEMVIPIGPCVIVIGGTCPDSSISFYLFTRKNPYNGQKVVVYPKWDNISLSNFNLSHPNKFLIHGYNGDISLGPLMDIKTEYLSKGEHNIWAVNWPSLCEAPCYPMAAYNTRHAGACIADFIKRLRHYHPLPDIHIIGFSLGAHVAAFTATHLRPFYTLPRITGLDPAMPFFMTSNIDHKLDPSDAKFVDVLHTNAFVQGKPDRCGHVDFYMNGGINQPGCFNASNPIGCDHHRSLMYFSESIRSKVGFWGWPCTGMVAYLKNNCPPRGEAVLMGDNVPQKARGYFLVYTAASSPYALGRWTGGDTNHTRWQRLVHRKGGRKEIETYLV